MEVESIKFENSKFELKIHKVKNDWNPWLFIVFFQIQTDSNSISLYRAVRLFDISFKICWNRERSNSCIFSSATSDLFFSAKYEFFIQFDRNGGYLKFF